MNQEIETGAPDGAARKGRAWMLVLAAVAAVLVASAAWLAARPTPPLVQGMADADEIKVAAKITGRIAAFEVREGDRVKTGQNLYTIDSPELLARRRQAEAALEVAKAMLDKAEKGARQQEISAARAQGEGARAGASLAQATFERMGNLYQEGVISRQQYDEAEANALSASAQEAAASAQYEQALEGTRSEDKAAAASQLRQAEGALAEVDAMFEETVMRAPVDGVVSKRLAEPGEIVPAGYPVLTILDPASTWVAVHVREDQFSGWAMDAKWRGAVPALDLEDVVFHVYFINPAGEFATWRATRESAGYDIKTFEIRLRPEQPLPGLRPGMSVLFGTVD